MKISVLFPNIYFELKINALIWDEEFEHANLFFVTELFGINMEKYSHISLVEFQRLSEIILKDIVAAKNNNSNQNIVKLNFLQISHCTEVARYFCSKGIFADCHDWLVYSVSDALNYDTETDFQIGRLNEFLTSSDLFISNNAITSIFEWSDILFNYSRHHGGLVEFTTIVFDFMNRLILHIYETKIPSTLAPEQLIRTTSEILAWTINYKKESSKDLAKCLSAYFDKTTIREEKKLIAHQLTLGGAENTGKTSTEWAQEVLNNYLDLLVGNQKMQILSKYLLDNFDTFPYKWEELKSAINEYNESLYANRDILIKYEKARLFGVLNGLVVKCIETDKFDYTSKIVSEYFEIDEKLRFTNKQLYIVCNYEYGVLYSTKELSILIENKSPDVFLNLIYQSNKFLSAKLSLNNYNGFKLEEPDNFGVPIKNEGILFEQRLKEHYKFERINQIDLSKLESLFILPGFQHPIQALMIKEIGSTLPINASLEQSKSRRKVKNVLLWCFGTSSSDFELSLLKKMFEASNVVVDNVDILTVDKSIFIQKYHSDKYDLVYIGTHGDYNHYNPHLSKIDLLPGEDIELHEMLNLSPNVDSQRLLFLNICDGATASTLNALYDIGFGASLCNNNQAVLSHIWMVEIAYSTIYGILYAHYLLEGFDFFQAYIRTIKAFLNGKEFIKETLGRYQEFENDLIYFLEKLDNNINENIYYWGSSVYYQ